MLATFKSNIKVYTMTAPYFNVVRIITIIINSARQDLNY